MVGPEPEQDVQARSAASIDAALRRVRLLTGVLIGARLVTTSGVPLWQVAAVVAAFLGVNLISLVEPGEAPRTRTSLAIIQLSADALIVLLVTALLRDTNNPVAWAVLMLPVIEGAVQFQLRGALI